MSENRVGDTLVAFGVGLLAGLAAGLLLAPKSGEETRRELGEMAGRFKEKTREETEKAKGFVVDQVKRVEHAIEEGKQAYRSGAPNKSS